MSIPEYHPDPNPPSPDRHPQQQPAHRPPPPPRRRDSDSGELTDDTPPAADPPSGMSSDQALMMDGADAGDMIDLPLNDADYEDDVCDVYSDEYENENENNMPQDDGGGNLNESMASLSVDGLQVPVQADVAVPGSANGSASTLGSPNGSQAQLNQQGSLGSSQPGSGRSSRRSSMPRRPSSATSFEMHDSLIFEELNKLVEDDTSSSDDDSDSDDETDEEDDGPAFPKVDPYLVSAATSAAEEAQKMAAAASHISRSESGDSSSSQNNRRHDRAGRRGSSRSLLSVDEDKEMDDQGENPKQYLSVVQRFEQQILDRLAHQDDTKGLVRSRSEAALMASRGGKGGGADTATAAGGPRKLSQAPTGVQSERNLSTSAAAAAASAGTTSAGANDEWPELRPDNRNDGKDGSKVPNRFKALLQRGKKKKLQQQER
jgi:hypothetical protein